MTPQVCDSLEGYSWLLFVLRQTIKMAGLLLIRECFANRKWIANRKEVSFHKEFQLKRHHRFLRPPSFFPSEQLFSTFAKIVDEDDINDDL